LYLGVGGTHLDEELTSDVHVAGGDVKCCVRAGRLVTLLVQQPHSRNTTWALWWWWWWCRRN